MTEPTTTKPKPAKSRKVMLVRFGRMKTLGVFEHEEMQIPKAPTQVVVKTERGLEMGEVIGTLTGYREGRFRFTEEQVCGYYANSEIPFSGELSGKFIRVATPDDISEAQHLDRISSEEIACCEQIARDLNLRMKIVGAEHIFGGERIIFFFMAEGRIDFRELVRRLAQEYQTRIEMRQIGSRDEAKLLGDIETCGQACCCLRFLQLLKPVNMRMAKMQKATLDPSKISGYCGRLKCCLRYEDDSYVELKKRLPRKNAWVQTKRGEGKVIDGQILTQLVVVEFESGEKEAFPLEEVTILPGPPVRPEKPPEDAAAAQRGERPQHGRRPQRHEYDNRRNRSDRNAGNNRNRIENSDNRDEGNRGDDSRHEDGRNGDNPNEDAGGEHEAFPQEEGMVSPGPSVRPEKPAEDTGAAQQNERQQRDRNERPQQGRRPPRRERDNRRNRGDRNDNNNRNRPVNNDSRSDNDRPDNRKDENPGDESPGDESPGDESPSDESRSGDSRDDSVGGGEQS